MREEYAKEYHAFLVRFWRDGPQRPWRVTISDPHTQKTTHFATVSELLTYFETLTADPPPNPQLPPHHS